MPTRSQYRANPEKYKSEMRVIYHEDPEKHRARVRGYHVKRHREDKDYYRRLDLKKNHGLTIEKYDELFSAQNGKCAICDQPPGARRLHVDHDHTTGNIRGLLCSNCNTAIGKLKDSTELMKRAIGYVEKNRAVV